MNNVQQGWLCPVCKTVNAPWSPACDCVNRPQSDQNTQQKVQESALAKLDLTKWGQQTTPVPDVTQVPHYLCCQRCRQHGLERIHGLMEVCPYAGRTA